MLPSLPKVYASPGVLKQPERLLKLQGGSSAPRAQGRKTHAKDIFNRISWRGPEGGGSPTADAGSVLLLGARVRQVFKAFLCGRYLLKLFELRTVFSDSLTFSAPIALFFVPKDPLRTDFGPKPKFKNKT